MTASELRLGNWILNDLNAPSEVNLLGHRIVECRLEGGGWQTVFNPQPIPMTEEWLLKFGFEHENTIGGWLKWGNRKLKLLDMKFYFNSSEYFMRVEYVHQLQNLYFALTGEELDIKK